MQYIFVAEHRPCAISSKGKSATRKIRRRCGWALRVALFFFTAKS